ncbi:MAG: bifunctional diaminohydroxyphosphoribosylaminopyrimidine deaminase/5-amino-6-(5-phosphoribosylamino)uracil reductase RibD [Kiritimatiellia bacterium]
MSRAWALALRSCGHTRPNPPVGAVVVKNGIQIGEGRHRRCGLAHAEVAALASCSVSPRGASVFCTLEPCSKPGRVGACCEALIAAGVARVEWACPDPNAKNGGRAARILRRAGIETVCWMQCPSADPRHRIACGIFEETLRPFAKHVTTGLPFVEVKLAMSLDGRICDLDGKSRWISGRPSLRETARWRERVDVVMVGAETIRRDDPSLLCHTRRNDDLWRAVVSGSGNLPAGAQVFADGARERTLVYSDPVAALEDLGRRGFMHVLCEGGLGLARSLAAARRVDKWTTILCPLVIGGRPLAEACRFRPFSAQVHGADIFSTNLCSQD